MASKKLNMNQMKRELRKEQDVLCASPNVHVMWLSLALMMLTHGDTVRATIYSPTGEATPKKRAAKIIDGAVIVKGKEYTDAAIADLVGKDIKGWKFAGDQMPDESFIVVGNKAFKSLAKALASL